MPFQDNEDNELTPVPRQPTMLERWLRKLMLEDWALKLLALAITVVLWLGVTGQNKPVTLRVNGVQLNFLRPAGMELSNEPPTTVDVIFTGSKDRLDRIEPRELIANVDLSDQKAGERIIKLTVSRVKMDLQEDVKIQGFYPASVPIRLEPVIEVPLDVEVQFEGKLPEGYELGSVTVSPAQVRLRGPADHINGLRKATTETVLLDDKKETFSLSQVEINIPDVKIDVLDSAVDIHVIVIEKRRGDLHLRLAADGQPYLATITKPAHQSDPLSLFPF
ncbi:MAG TPA: CdaR family protein [Pyrinomonadaceae bacterium]|nr:CdaR family protein [Pyrinomonadaceae bacterium]